MKYYIAFKTEIEPQHTIFIRSRLTIIKMTENNKYWQRCREMGIHVLFLFYILLIGKQNGAATLKKKSGSSSNCLTQSYHLTHKFHSWVNTLKV